MGRHVAFLRAINLGSKRRVAMADLRAAFEDLGLVDGADLHQLVRGGYLDSRVTAKALAAALGDNPGTNRSTTMLRKLVAKL